MLDLSCPEKDVFWHSIRQRTLHLKISLKSITGLSLDCFEIQVKKQTVCCWLFVFGPHSLSRCFDAGALQQWHLWLSLVGEELTRPGAGVAEESGWLSAHHSRGLGKGLEKRKLCNQPTRFDVGAGVFPKQSF